MIQVYSRPTRPVARVATAMPSHTLPVPKVTMAAKKEASSILPSLAISMMPEVWMMSTPSATNRMGVVCRMTDTRKLMIQSMLRLLFLVFFVVAAALAQCGGYAVKHLHDDQDDDQGLHAVARVLGRKAGSGQSPSCGTRGR